jgi:hypothetical protein
MQARGGQSCLRKHLAKNLNRSTSICIRYHRSTMTWSCASAATRSCLPVERASLSARSSHQNPSPSRLHEDLHSYTRSPRTIGVAGCFFLSYDSGPEVHIVHYQSSERTAFVCNLRKISWRGLAENVSNLQSARTLLLNRVYQCAFSCQRPRRS